MYKGKGRDKEKRGEEKIKGERQIEKTKGKQKRKEKSRGIRGEKEIEEREKEIERERKEDKENIKIVQTEKGPAGGGL